MNLQARPFHFQMLAQINKILLWGAIMAYVSKISVLGIPYPIRDTETHSLAEQNSASIKTANTNIDNLQTAIHESNTNIANVSNTVESNWKTRIKIGSRKFFFIGDSYGFGYTPGAATSQGWFYWVAKYLGLRKDLDYWTVPYSVLGDNSGYGMSYPDVANQHVSWATALDRTDTSNIPTDKITDVIILGGTNDTAYIANIGAGMELLNTKIKQMFPNANISCGVYANCPYSNFTSDSGIKGVFKEYNKCTRLGWHWYPNTVWSCHMRSYIASDNVHLTQTGYGESSRYLAQAIAYGYCDVIFSDVKVPSNRFSSDVTMNNAAEIWFTFVNGIIHVTQKRGVDSGIPNNMQITVPRSGTYIIATIPDFVYAAANTRDVQVLEVGGYWQYGNVRFSEIYIADVAMYLAVRCEDEAQEGVCFFFGQCASIDCWN